MSQSNSTKKAVALKYDESQGAAPVIVASGLGHMAEKLVEVANQADVPVYEDTSLSTVLSQLELGAQIPEEVYRAVVEIYVFFLKFKP
ncbi:EscU/YscU/HrcU family type III secretion system export apparatus switch protein [Aminipila sp.]|uniref:EscU/YscU/HrcU family type III secretion system export apparatus switch protein n=1 Tax=Aminipila sp. TaxID=2060095 RepID=UPI00289749B9|nr:EscU/YscU/HrcU family type III secretion system export apparatus switch protein [Aminipila sp.]